MSREQSRPAAGEREPGGPAGEPSPAGRLPRFYAWLAVRIWPLLIAAVLAAAFGAYWFLPSISSAPNATTKNLLPSHPQALQVEKRSAALFGVPLLTPFAVVQRNPHGLSVAQQALTVAKAVRIDRGTGPPDLRKVFAVPILNTLGLFPGSREHGTTAITYLFFRGVGGTGEADVLAHKYADYLGPGLAVVGTAGAAPARLAQLRIIRNRVHWMEGATVVLILLIVGIAFQALLAPLITVVTAGLAFVISQHVLGYVSTASGLTMPSELTAVAVALMLGIVTDYSVFLFTGTRERLRLGDSNREAVRRTMAVNLPIVVTAGAVVSIGVASLMLGTLGFFRSFGPGMAITVATGLLVTVTFVPATLRVLGRAAFWPGFHSGPLEIRDWRRRLARLTTRKAVALGFVAVAVGVLALAATGLDRFSLGFALVRSLPAGNPVAVASQDASKGFAPGVLAPTELLVRAPGIAHERAALNRLQGLLGREPHVAGVLGPADQPTPARLGAVLAPKGNAARYAVILDSDPTDAPAIRHLRQVKRDLPGLLRRAGLGSATVGLGGETALALETVRATKTSLWRVIAGAFGVNFVFLLLFLRSPVAPFYLLGASALGLAATFGLTLYFFTGLLGYPGLPYYLPVAFSVLLLSLGSDYNIFVVGRIWQEAERRPLDEAIATATPRAGRAILIAGLALALSFTLLAIIPIEPFAVMAFAMAVGILLDTLVVRTVLVPGLIVLFGRFGRWPHGRPPPQARESERDVAEHDRGDGRPVAGR